MIFKSFLFSSLSFSLRVINSVAVVGLYYGVLIANTLNWGCHYSWGSGDEYLVCYSDNVMTGDPNTRLTALSPCSLLCQQC